MALTFDEHSVAGHVLKELQEQACMSIQKEVANLLGVRPGLLESYSINDINDPEQGCGVWTTAD